MGAYGAYGVMAALEFVELSEAVRVRLGTLLSFGKRNIEGYFFAVP